MPGNHCANLEVPVRLSALFANILEPRRIVKAAATSSSPQRRRQERIPPEVQRASQEPTKRPGEPSDDLTPFPVEIWERE